MTNRFSSFSLRTAPILTGKQVVRFAPEMLEYISKNGCFPVGRDGRGDYLHLQFVFENGATTASFKESQQKDNPKYMDNIKLYFDGKNEGDGYLLRRTFDEIRKTNSKFKNMTAEEILYFLMDKKFPVWFYRYQGKYLQAAWNARQYEELTAGRKQTAAKKVEVVEEELPIDF